MNPVLAVARKEVIEVLRDKRSLYVLLLLPIALYPVLVIGTTFLATLQLRKLAEKTHPVWVEGWDELPESLQQTFRGELDEAEEGTEDDFKQVRQLKLQFSAPPPTPQLPGAEPLTPDEYYKQALADDLARAVVRGAATLNHLDPERVPQLEVLYNGGIDASRLTRKRLVAVFDQYAAGVVAKRIDDASLPDTTLTPFTTKTVDKGREGALLGRMLGALLVVLALTGAFYPALDMGAGEKERGTLETLLLAPISRATVAQGKFWAVFVISLVVALLNLLSLGLTFAFSAGSLGEMNFTVDFTALAACFFVLVPLVAMFSALSLATSTYAASYKEGQAYLTPLMILGTVPPLAAALPGVQLDGILSLTPVLGASLLIKGLFAGTANLSHGVLVFGSNVIYALVAIRWVASLYEREEVLWRPAAAAAPDLLGLRRETPAGGVPSMPQALALGVVVLTLHFFVGAWAQRKDILGGLAFDLIVLVAGSSVLYGWWLRCDLRQTFSWRPPPAWGWAAAVLLGLGAMTINLDLGAVQAGWLPKPTVEEQLALEKFNQILSAKPWWLLLLVIAVLPGIMEELCFRGFILRGLRSEVSPWLAIVIAGVMFAVVHLDPSRLLPQFFAGCVAGALVVRTGSIWPAMLFHGIHNGLLVGLEGLGEDTVGKLIDLTAETPTPSGLLRTIGWVAAAVGVGLCVALTRRSGDAASS